MSLIVEALSRTVGKCLSLSKEISDRLTLVQNLALETEKDLDVLIESVTNLLAAMRKQDERITVLEGVMLKEAKAVKGETLLN